MIHSDAAWNRISAGDYVERACATEGEPEVATSSAAKAFPTETMCVRNSKGEPDLTRDCSRMAKVGNMLFAIPISMPATPKLAGYLSVVMKELTELGRYQEILDRHVRKTIEPTVRIDGDYFYHCCCCHYY